MAQTQNLQEMTRDQRRSSSGSCAWGYWGQPLVSDFIFHD